MENEVFNQNWVDSVALLTNAHLNKSTVPVKLNNQPGLQSKIPKELTNVIIISLTYSQSENISSHIVDVGVISDHVSRTSYSYSGRFEIQHHSGLFFVKDGHMKAST